MDGKKYKSLRVSPETHGNFKYVALALGIDLSDLLANLSRELFEIFSEFKRGTANIMYTESRGKLIINAFGKSRVISGTARNDMDMRRQLREADKHE